MRYRRTTATALAVLAFVAGCELRAGPNPDVAVTSTYLQCAVKDLLGDEFEVMCLAGPGNCPGHFDITPVKAIRLRRCRVLLRFDFQQNLDAKLKPDGADGPRIVPVEIKGGLCEPASYLSACRQVADALVAAGLIERVAADARLAEIDSRLKALAARSGRRVRKAGLSGAAVLSGSHQAKFCRWLGLNVVATFRGEDNPGEVVRAISAGRDVRLIVGNVPAGRVVADLLAGALGGRPRVVMFDNFPSPEAGGFDAMLRGNVDRLIDRGGGP